MDTLITPPGRGTSPARGPPPACEQTLNGYLPLNQKIQKFRIECKWKD